MNNLLNEPEKLESVFIHKEDKDYVIAITHRDLETKLIAYDCLLSKDGFKGISIKTGIFSIASLPKPDNNIYTSSIRLSKYLKKTDIRLLQ